MSNGLNMPHRPDYGKHLRYKDEEPDKLLRCPKCSGITCESRLVYAMPSRYYCNHCRCSSKRTEWANATITDAVKQTKQDIPEPVVTGTREGINDWTPSLLDNFTVRQVKVDDPGGLWLYSTKDRQKAHEWAKKYVAEWRDEVVHVVRPDGEREWTYQRFDGKPKPYKGKISKHEADEYRKAVAAQTTPRRERLTPDLWDTTRDHAVAGPTDYRTPRQIRLRGTV